MILKKLEIAGFKSFGKAITLEFDSPITAIVGPNGSGKSNVSEAIRWVLGEQSMKSLRGKRGEDLIFHGSGEAAQLGKARVGITFDNTEQTFPLDFSEITISREVYRDGVNEYRVNDSQVRLKDIIELMSNVGVGGSGHHIISQGEADRVLYASAKDRKIMIEDALGLRIYHIKQQEAERKLVSTAENMHEVSMLRREIQPHMRFLRGEAEKVESSKKIRDELVELLRVYVNREHASLEALRRAFEEREKPLQNELTDAEIAAVALETSLSEKQSMAESSTPKEVEDAIRQLGTLDAKRRDIEREIGRVEGQLAILGRIKTEAKETRVWSADEVENEMQSILSVLDIAIAFKTIETIHDKLSELKERINRFLSGGAKERVAADESMKEQEELRHAREKLFTRLKEIEEEQKHLRDIRHNWDDLRRNSQAGLWEGQKELRVAQERVHAAKDMLRSLEVERERLRMRAEEFERGQAEAAVFLGIITPRDALEWPEEERAKEYQKIRLLGTVRRSPLLHSFHLFPEEKKH